MARESSVRSSVLATQTIELFRGGKHTTTSVGTTAVAIPATNLSGRKAIGIQNLHDTNLVYISVEEPEMLASPRGNPEDVIVSGMWKKSTAGNEWYYVSNAGAPTGMTQPTVVYYATIGGAETLSTGGTVGSLSTIHYWGWGDGDTLGFSTFYIRTGGTTQTYRPDNVYQVILCYSNMPDSSSGYGWCLGDHDGITINLDGSARMFAISSGATTPVVTLELR